MRFLLWFVAFVAALIALVVSAFVGQTPLTQGLVGLALVAGFLGALAGRRVGRWRPAPATSSPRPP